MYVVCWKCLIYSLQPTLTIWGKNKIGIKKHNWFQLIYSDGDLTQSVPSFWQMPEEASNVMFVLTEVSLSIFRPSYSDAWRIITQNLISSIYSWRCIHVPSVMKIHQCWDFALTNKNSILRPISLTFDNWRWSDLVQNLISSSTPRGVPLYQVLMNIFSEVLEICANEVKIASLDQVHWPLTFDV